MDRQQDKPPLPPPLLYNFVEIGIYTHTIFSFLVPSFLLSFSLSTDEQPPGRPSVAEGSNHISGNYRYSPPNNV